MADAIQLGTGKYPFSKVLWAGETAYVSGHLGIDLAMGKGPDDPEAEARMMMDGFKATLAGAGLSMDDLVSVDLFCTDLSLFGLFNAVYTSYFTEPYPARAFIGVSDLLFERRFEVQGVAVRNGASTKRCG